MRIWLSLSVAMVLAGVLIIYKVTHKPVSQISCSFVQNVDLQRVSWQKNLPVKLYVHHSVPPQFYGAIERAIQVWNRRLGVEALRIQGWGISNYDQPQHDGMSVIYWLHDWDADKPTEQARTTIYWTGNQIYEADMRINAKNFQFYPGDEVSPFYSRVPLVPSNHQPLPSAPLENTAASSVIASMRPLSLPPPVPFSGVDFESLVLHELGHVLGLAHTATIGSVMVPSLASGLVRRTPSETDIQALKCEY